MRKHEARFAHAEAMAAVGEKKYALSCEIQGHSADVRAVSCLLLAGETREHIVTGSRDGTACVWRPDPASGTEYILQKVIRKHTGYVSALCVIPPDTQAGRHQPLLATGSQDATILVHSLSAEVKEPLERYTGHQDMVTTITYQHGQLVSGSWDSCVRVWKSGGGSSVFKAHAPAVWAVAGLFVHDRTRRILSGGADRKVKLWEVDSGVCLQEYAGHNDVVRDIKIVSHQVFISAANDSSLRRWNLHTGQCLNEMCGHQAYVYSVSLVPGTLGEEVVSGGEDSSLRVWKGASCRQVVGIPATSVWCVCCLDNQDIVAGSSDGIVRVFSADPERIASPELIANFEEKMEVYRRQSKKSDIDVSSLPGTEALSSPGHKPGQTLMINNGGVAEVHQWNADTEQWDKIGDAISKAPESSLYQGQEYDYVFDIELDEGGPTMRKLKLPYNKDADPYVAAMEFLQANDLPDMYLDQVAEFIVQNAGEYQGPVSSGPTDPFTGGARYVPESGRQSDAGSAAAQDPFTGGSRYRPTASSGGSEPGVGASPMGGEADPLTGGRSYRPQEFSQAQPQFSVNFTGSGVQPSNAYFPMREYKFFSSPSDYAEKVMGKIMEFNGALDQARQLKDEELRRCQAMCSSLTSSQADSVTVATADLQLIERILHWPPDHVFPGLDILRLALLNKCGCKYFVGDEDGGKVFLGELLALAVGSRAQPKNQLLVLRCLANMFLMDSGQRLMDGQRKWVLSQLEPLLTLSSKNHQVALSTVLLNYCVHYYKSEKEDGVTDCTRLAVKVLKTSFDSQAKLRILIGLGGLASVKKTTMVSSALPDNLRTLVDSHTSSANTSQVSECARYVIQALR